MCKQKMPKIKKKKKKKKTRDPKREGVRAGEPPVTYHNQHTHKQSNGRHAVLGDKEVFPSHRRCQSRRYGLLSSYRGPPDDTSEEDPEKASIGHNPKEFELGPRAAEHGAAG